MPLTDNVPESFFWKKKMIKSADNYKNMEYYQSCKELTGRN